VPENRNGTSPQIRSTGEAIRYIQRKTEKEFIPVATIMKFLLAVVRKGLSEVKNGSRVELM
jgi:hypothetical protein